MSCPLTEQLYRQGSVRYNGNEFYLAEDRLQIAPVDMQNVASYFYSRYTPDLLSGKTRDVSTIAPRITLPWTESMFEFTVEPEIDTPVAFLRTMKRVVVHAWRIDLWDQHLTHPDFRGQESLPAGVSIPANQTRAREAYRYYVRTRSEKAFELDGVTTTPPVWTGEGEDHALDVWSFIGGLRTGSEGVNYGGKEDMMAPFVRQALRLQALREFHPTIRWLQVFTVMADVPERGVMPVLMISACANEDGSPVRHGYMSISAPEPRVLLPLYDIQRESTHHKLMLHCAAILAQYVVYPVFLAISFAHCRNVTEQTHEPEPVPERLARAQEKRDRKQGKPPRQRPIRYRTLRIKAMERILDEEGKAREKGLEHALSWCRGHFKHYGAKHGNKGLGRSQAEGMWWWGDQLRGNPKRGVVMKDYAIDAPVEEIA